MGWNVVCQPGYVAEEAVAAATDGLGHGRETSGRGDLHIQDELVPIGAGSCSITHTENTKNPCDLVLCSMTLKFNSVLEVVELHVRAKFHQAECSGL